MFDLCSELTHMTALRYIANYTLWRLCATVGYCASSTRAITVWRVFLHITLSSLHNMSENTDLVGRRDAVRQGVWDVTRACWGKIGSVLRTTVALLTRKTPSQNASSWHMNHDTNLSQLWSFSLHAKLTCTSRGPSSCLSSSHGSWSSVTDLLVWREIQICVLCLLISSDFLNFT